MSDHEHLAREVHEVSPQLAAMEALAHTREAALFTKTAVERIEHIFEQLQTPPEIRTVILSQAQPVATDDSKWEALSVGFINPQAFPIYFGLGGVSPTLLGRAPSISPQGILVLPVRMYRIELGVDPANQAALAAGNALVTVMRFSSVQPTFAGDLS